MTTLIIVASVLFVVLIIAAIFVVIFWHGTNKYMHGVDSGELMPGMCVCCVGAPCFFLLTQSRTHSTQSLSKTGGKPVRQVPEESGPDESSGAEDDDDEEDEEEEDEEEGDDDDDEEDDRRRLRR